MFTGIVDSTAIVTRVAARGSGALLAVSNPWQSPPAQGQSISVNGACLTVVSANGREISFDVSAETLKKTTFSRLRAGSVVNLEGALKVGDALSGHFVSGHVDATAEVARLDVRGEFALLEIRIPAGLEAYLVSKGSVAVEGVSLTIAYLGAGSFTVAVIPETLKRTTLGGLKAGDAVNIETDMLGKYVIRYISLAGGGSGAPGAPGEEGAGVAGLTVERLKKAGF